MVMVVPSRRRCRRRTVCAPRTGRYGGGGCSGLRSGPAPRCAPPSRYGRVHGDRAPAGGRDRRRLRRQRDRRAARGAHPDARGPRRPGRGCRTPGGVPDPGLLPPDRTVPAGPRRGRRTLGRPVRRRRAARRVDRHVAARTRRRLPRPGDHRRRRPAVPRGPATGAGAVRGVGVDPPPPRRRHTSGSGVGDVRRARARHDPERLGLARTGRGRLGQGHPHRCRTRTDAAGRPVRGRRRRAGAAGRVAHRAAYRARRGGGRLRPGRRRGPRQRRGPARARRRDRAARRPLPHCAPAGRDGVRPRRLGRPDRAPDAGAGPRTRGDAARRPRRQGPRTRRRRDARPVRSRTGRPSAGAVARVAVPRRPSRARTPPGGNACAPWSTTWAATPSNA